MAAVRHVEFSKIFISIHVTVIEFQMCCCVSNFIKIGWFFVQMWRFHDSQDGGCPPFWILRVQKWVVWKAHVWLPIGPLTDHSSKLLSFEKIALLYKFWRQTDIHTDEQTDGQHRCVKPPLVSRAASQQVPLPKFWDKLHPHAKYFLKLDSWLLSYRLKRFSIWRPCTILNSRNVQFMSRDLYRHAILLSHAKFHRKRTIFRWDMAI